MLVGMTRHDPDRMRRISKSEVSVDLALGSDELDAQTSFDGNLNEDLFGDPDVQGDAEADQIAEDSTSELEPYIRDSTLDDEGDQFAAAEPEDDIVDETASPSPMKNSTRSKSKKVIIPDLSPVMYSDPEVEEPRPRQHKRTHDSPAQILAGGTSKYFRRNSNQFPSIASNKLAASKGRAGSRGPK